MRLLNVPPPARPLPRDTAMPGPTITAGFLGYNGGMMVPLAIGILELGGFALLSAALGKSLLALAKLPHLRAAERLFLACTVGLGALQIVPWTLFALGIGTASAFRWCTLVLTLVLAPQMFALLRAGIRRLRLLRRLKWWESVMFGLVGLLMATLFLRAVCPDIGGDALGYHLTVASRYLKYARFTYVPTVTPTNFPVGLESLYAWVMALAPGGSPAIIHFLFGVMVVLGAWLLAVRLGGRFAGAVTLGLLVLYDGFSVQGLWDQMTSCYVDLGLTAFTVAAILCMHLAQTEPDIATARRFRLLCAIFAGLSADAKLTGVWVILSMTLLTAILDTRREGRLRIGDAFRFLLIAVAVASPWFVRTWIVTGNPIYPMAYNLFGGIEWTASGWARFQRAHMMYNTPPGFAPTQTVLKTVHLINGLVGIVVAAAALRPALKSRMAAPLGFAALFFACICAGNYLHPRFLMPAVPALLACIAAALPRPNRFAAPALCALTLIVCCVMNAREFAISLPEAARYALGGESRDAFLNRRLPDYAVTQWANANLPTSAPLLVGTYEYNLALYRADAMWPDYWLQDSIHYDSQQRLRADLRRLGVRYLVLKWAFPKRCPGSWNCRERLNHERPALFQLAADCGRLLYARNDHMLYEIRP